MYLYLTLKISDLDFLAEKQKQQRLVNQNFFKLKALYFTTCLTVYKGKIEKIKLNKSRLIFE